MEQHEIPSIRQGAGSLKYYNYYANGIKLKSKSAVLEAIELKISKIGRVDKITKKFEPFDYKKMDFC